MSIIAVKGIPLQWQMSQVIKKFEKQIKGDFEGLNFKYNKNKREKILYIQLSEKLDPLQVVEQINGANTFGQVTLEAYLPDYVPDFPLAEKKTTVPLQKPLRTQVGEKKAAILLQVHKEILVEMQSKYTGLYKLYKKNPNLMPEIAQIIFDRLKTIVDNNPDAAESCAALSKAYRKSHPHFGDFQFILSSLHKIQDAAGVPREQIVESELCEISPYPFEIDQAPLQLVQDSCNKYSARIIKKMTNHINNLKFKTLPCNSKEDKARRRVRSEMRKLVPFLPWIVKQVISKHLVAEKVPYIRIRVYGEPILPSDEQMLTYLKKFGVTKVMRSENIFNLMRFRVASDKYDALMKEDGAVVEDAKLIIRTDSAPVWTMPKDLRDDLLATLGLAANVQLMEVDLDRSDDDEEY